MKQNSKAYLESANTDVGWLESPAEEFAKPYLLKNTPKLDLPVTTPADRLAILKTAIKRNDDAAIMSAWDEVHMADLPEVRPLMLRVQRAFQPNDVENVDAVHYGSFIRVRWKTNRMVDRYLVSWSTGNYPTDVLPGYSKMISRHDYERFGCRIENSLRQNYFIRVYAITDFGRQELVSPGESLGCRTVVLYRRKTTIRYSIRFRGLFRKTHAILTLIPDKPVDCLPEVLLIARDGELLPAHVRNGEVVCRMAGERLKEHAAYGIQFRLTELPSPTRFRLFLANPEDAGDYELLPTAAAKLRI